MRNAGPQIPLENSTETRQRRQAGSGHHLPQASVPKLSPGVSGYRRAPASAGGTSAVPGRGAMSDGRLGRIHQTALAGCQLAG